MKKNQPYTPPADVDLTTTIEVPTFQDQGFTRPKVLLLLPYRHYARLFVETMLSLLPRKMNVFGKGKFLEEFADEEDDPEEKAPRWKTFFPGNNDGSGGESA